MHENIAKNNMGKLFRPIFALLIPFFTLIIQLILWPAVKPYVWFFFYPAVFFSSWIGGIRSGMAATFISCALVKWFFIPPIHSFMVQDYKTFFSMVVFTGMGVLFSISHERLKKANQRAADALEAARHANEQLRNINENITALYNKKKELDELKTQFFANVSHELRTPLTLILGPVDKLLQGSDLTAEQRYDLKMVDRNARLLYRHVSDLLDVAKLEGGRMVMHYTEVDLVRLTGFIASHFELLATEKQIHYTVQVPEKLPAQIDAEKCQRILLNLLANAFKFTPEGGDITLTLNAEDNKAVFRVRDNGPGIPPDKREVIFERFHQLDGKTNRRYGGTGLGLSIVKEFVGLHDGIIKIDDGHDDGGTTFTIELPLRAPEGTAIQANPSVGDEEMNESELVGLLTPIISAPAFCSDRQDAPLVLVVEDNPEMNAYVAEALSQRFRVSIAFDGQEGLNKALKEHPDLIISDVMMPHMSGDQMVEALRRHQEMNDVPVVMLTAKADEMMCIKMLQEGAQDYIFKPFVVEELLARVDSLMAERHKIREARRQLAQSEDKAEESIRQLNQHKQLILDAAGEGIVGLDVNGRVTFINPAATAMTGYKTGELLGNNLHERIHHTRTDGRPYLVSECPMHISITEGKTSRVHDEVLWRQDGSSFPASYSSTAIVEQEEIVGAVVVFRDISDRKQAEAERNELEAQLQQAQKLEAIGTLAGGIAHDFNNILMVILGYAELASVGLPKDSQSFSNLSEVIKAGNRATDLVQQILAFSRPDRGKQQLVQLGPLIKECLKMLDATLPKTIDIRSSIVDNGVVDANPVQLHQIIMNLCTNAYHAMRDKGGILEVSLVSIMLNDAVADPNLDLPSGPYLQLSISDTGYGIEPLILERIFEPFFTTKKPGEGTGLGLSVVHGIVRNLGGVIKVYSEPGKGTVFHIFLPQVLSDAGTSVAEADERALPKGTERILVIDDEEALTILICNILESLGYEVTAFNSSIAALENFRNHPDKFDLVLTDQIMPQMTGLELSRRLMQIRPDIPIILCTGFSPAVDLEIIRVQGMKKLLTKPIMQKKMAETIRQVLDQYSK